MKIEKDYILKLYEPNNGQPPYYAHNPSDLDIWGVKVPLLTKEEIQKDPNQFEIHATVLYFPQEHDASVRMNLFKFNEKETVNRPIIYFTFDC